MCTYTRPFVLKIWFSTFSVSIFSTQNGILLWLLCSSFGYSTSTYQIYPFLSSSISLSIFFRGKIIDSIPYKSMCWQFLDNCPSIKVISIYISKVCFFIEGMIVLAYFLLIISLAMAFYCWSNVTWDTFFQSQHHVYFSK